MGLCHFSYFAGGAAWQLRNRLYLSRADRDLASRDWYRLVRAASRGVSAAERRN